jgi:hypothetical protein
MRYRFAGDRITMLDGKARAPFRRTDLSPREELSEAQHELAQLEQWRIANTKWKTWPASDCPEMKRIAELKQKVYALDYWLNDSAPASAPKAIELQSTADLNRRNAEYWETRP